MNSEQAKEILRLYRPGTADADDPSFAEALAYCEHDSEMNRWFKEHCALYAAIRLKFKQIPVPEGLKEQIIAERKVHTTPMWQKAVLTAGALAVMVMAAFWVFTRPPAEPTDFAAFRGSAVTYAARAYIMALNTDNLDAIRQFLAQTNAIADFVLPEALQKNATATGCAMPTWQGKQYSMICFKTGRPLTGGDKSDLWLMVADNSVAKDAPNAASPQFKQLGDYASASWTVGGRTYVLATKGDEQFLRKYL